MTVKVQKKLAPRRSDCPLSVALELLGDRWTILVLRDLLFLKKSHFQDFLASEEGIASNILSDRLRLLESAGLITRHPDPANARKIIYRPTDRAVDLVPALLELMRWSAEHDGHTKASPQFIKRIKREREVLVSEVRAFFANATGADGRR